MTIVTIPAWRPRFFDDEEISRLLRDEGFTGIELFGPEEAVRTYFPARSDVHIGNVQRVALAAVGGADTGRGAGL